jgi:hypothetical protein
LSKFAVFQPRVGDDQQWVQPVDQKDFERFRSLNGELARDWVSPPMRFVREGRNGRVDEPRTDVCWLASNTMVFRSRAFESAREFLQPWGQFLELKLDGESETLWLFNVRTVIDALDESASKLTYFPDGVRIMFVHEWVFKDSVIPDPCAFRIPVDDVRK